MNNASLARLLDSIVGAAQRGWTPDDLLHVAGRDIHPLLYQAAPRIPARVASPALRHEWLMLAPPKNPFYKPQRVSEWLDQVPFLPHLRDVQILANPLNPRLDGDSQDTRIRRKVEALLRKAESTSFPDEADALVARAQQLRQDYRLSDESPDGPAVARRIRLSAPYVKHKFTLLCALCRANGVSSLLLHDSGIATLFGAPEDVEHVCDLYPSLERQCRHFMNTGVGADLARMYGQTASYRRSFQLAYAARIAELLMEANDAAAAAPQPNAGEKPAARDEENARVPVVVRRTALAEQERARLFPHLSTMSLSANHALGLRDGVEAAESSHLRGDSTGVRGGRRALPAA